MEKNIRIDSHKLIYHPDVVARWLKGEEICPIEIEIAPSGACNHRCVFCAVDYMEYKPYNLDVDNMLSNIKEMASRGLKSIICAGEGEPLLNKGLSRLVHGVKSNGVDIAMSTNGVLLTEDFARECLGDFTWIRYSVASLDNEPYYKIQQAKKGDLEIVKKNLIDAVKVKRDNKYRTTLGVQCLLMPDNKDYIVSMAKQLKEIGVDYFTVKPYSQHPNSQNRIFIDYKEMLELEKELNDYKTDSYSIFFRAKAMEKMHTKKDYEKCLGLPFMTYIDSRGDIWPCIAFMGKKEYCYGNINENTFFEIWEGEKRKAVNRMIAESDINVICREACRLDEINRYLTDLVHPGEHVNFI